MKKILCWLFGHKPWKPYDNDWTDPYCPRCKKHTTTEELFKDLGRR